MVWDIFFHDFEGSKDSLVLTSRSVTYFEKGFIRGLENFYPLSQDVHIFLKRRIKSYTFYPLCHDVYTLWRRRIKSYIFSSKLSWANSDVMIPSVCKTFVCFINGQTWNPHPTSVSSSTTLHYTPTPTNLYKPTHNQHTNPTNAPTPYIPTLPLHTYPT